MRSANNSEPVLKLVWRGHVPSFKNGKLLSRGNLITDPRKQKIMDGITAAFREQLDSRSMCQTAAAGILTG